MESDEYEEILKSKFKEFYLFAKKEAKKSKLSASEMNPVIERVLNELIEKALENLKQTEKDVDEFDLENKKNELKHLLMNYKDEIES